MKRRVVLGALMLSVVLAGQSFGFELLDNLLGGRHGCNACCEPQACEPACCEKSCEPACCEKSCEPNCCDPCCRKHRCDLFAGLKGLFSCKKCNACCENACCETKACAPEPKCCEPQACEKACEPACDPCEPACEPNCCDPCCKRRCTPVLDLLEDICSLRINIYKKAKCRNACGENACCEPNCCEEASDCGCNGTTTVPSRKAPKAAPAEKAAPLPAAPTADPSASLYRTRNVRQASRTVVIRG